MTVSLELDTCIQLPSAQRQLDLFVEKRPILKPNRLFLHYLPLPKSILLVKLVRKIWRERQGYVSGTLAETVLGTMNAVLGPLVTIHLELVQHLPPTGNGLLLPQQGLLAGWGVQDA